MRRNQSSTVIPPSMAARHRVVTHTPLTEPWHDRLAPGGAVRREDLGREAVRALLRHGPVRFVIADVGRPLEWIEPSAGYDVGRREARDVGRIDRGSGVHASLATRWTASPWDKPVVVLTEMH